MHRSPCSVALCRALPASLSFLVACASAQVAPATPPASSPAPAPVAAQVPASPPPAAAPAAATAPACPRALALDPAAIEAEAVCLLAAYVRIDTTNPPGRELAAAHFLRDLLARDGIESQIIESTPGRGNLIARVRGSGAGRAVALLHHMDVVPADASEWSVPPFAGEVQKGSVWGRGALDNKGPGIVAVMTMLLAKRLGTVLPRDLVLIAVADEEAGGGLGARFLTERHMPLLADVEFVLNEGGAILEVGEGRVAYNVELAQKAPLWLKLTARGRSGHGATPMADTAVTTLLRALSRLAAHRFPVVVLPEVQALYASRAPAMPAAARADYADLRKALQRRAFRDQFLKEGRDAALVQNTLSITMLQGSDKENVIPGQASAVLDMRLLPGQDAEAVTREVKQVMAEPGIEVTPLLSWRAHAAPRDTALFRAIEAFAERRDPGAPVVANVIGGFTDCNAFRAQGITCYGFVPIRLRPDFLAGVHGKDEHIGTAAMAGAVVDLHALLLSLGAPPPAAPP